MQITYQLTQQDFVESLKACRQRSVFRRWMWRLLPVIPISLVFLSIFLYVEDSRDQVASNLFPLLVLLAFWIVLLWVGPWLGARTQFRKQPSVQGSKTLSVDGSGVHWKWDGGSADIDWKNFLKWQESKTQFLLYTSPVAFNMIPKRVLTQEQISEVRLTLSQNIPVRTS
jgi:YcxB-like protein